MFIDIINSKKFSRSINIDHIVSIEIVESSFNAALPFQIKMSLITRDEELLGPWATYGEALAHKKTLVECVHDQ